MTSIERLPGFSFPSLPQMPSRTARIGGVVAVVALVALMDAKPAEAAVPMAAAIPVVAAILSPLGAGLVLGGVCIAVAATIIPRAMPTIIENMNVRDGCAAAYAIVSAIPASA